MLGIRYITAAGYDPGARPTCSPRYPGDRARGADPGQGQPLDPRMGKHSPVERKPRAARAGRGAATGRLGPACAIATLAGQLEGLYVDDDPAQGMIDGRSFTHPDLRMQFIVPVGYQMQRHPRGDDLRLGGKAQFGGGALSGSLED